MFFVFVSSFPIWINWGNSLDNLSDVDDDDGGGGDDDDNYDDNDDDGDDNDAQWE